MKATIKTKATALMAAVVILGSCQQDKLLVSESTNDLKGEITFKNYVDNSTSSRASKRTSADAETFSLGESMAVWGHQFTGDIVDTIFFNQKVDYQGNDEW